LVTQRAIAPNRLADVFFIEEFWLVKKTKIIEHMETFINITLGVHVVSGFTALLCGLIAMLAKKGGKTHTRNGFIFFIAMLTVSLSAVAVSLQRDNQFLLHIGLFALYQNVSGYRAIKNKSRKANWLDWGMVAIGAINGAFMVATLNIVLAVFGGISLLLVAGDLNIYIRAARNLPIAKNEWLRQHIGMMMGTYIATSTAFLLVNLRTFEPYWLPWLAPTVLGVPFLMYMSRKHAPRKKVVA
jgi:uncharacterized membrane protein